MMTAANSALLRRATNSIADLVGEEVAKEVIRLLDLEDYLLRNYDEAQWDGTTKELLGLEQEDEE